MPASIPCHRVLRRAVKFPSCRDLLMPEISALLLCSFSEQSNSQIELRHFLQHPLP